MWAIYAVIAAVCWATADLLSKIAMNKQDLDEYITLYSRFFFSIPFLVIFLYISSPHNVSSLFWLMCLLVVPGDIVASTLYIKALKISPISIVVPLMSFAPVFMLLSSPIILGEWPSPLGILGVLLVTTGAYVMHIDRLKSGVLEPIKAIYKDKGPLFVIIAAAIFSIDTAIGKKAVQYSDPVFFSFYYCLFMTLGYTPIVLRSSHSVKRLSFLKRKVLWGIGACFGIGVVAFLYAIQLANIAYVSAFGKISMLVAVLYGKIFFQEEGLKRKLTGVLLMLIGIYFIFAS
ncbi:conserved hypothetical protein [Thermosulfidibacter takaii ABI70S6]|uniref:EamA domain-containing protein n=1 Tax=Thermosulfidibacter takaii (strain DSM 17441 / JCM 13301 / NBRC 103674 / ABI70S6) TaxID=1298851 RepID=A0A0S3QVQ5_THET7|nr:DMT family transporter [Thermosulfidibacter takaii]BAT72409.1 conserved hypothetical protein [Thermosulfidibacter takaii ABI70S6]